MSGSCLPDEVRRIYLPYAIERIEDGRHVVLNRRYKPLGMHATDWIDYTPHAVRLKGLTAKKAQAMSWNNSPALDVVYLYNDGCIPTEGKAHWDAYQQRLSILAKLKAE